MEPLHPSKYRLKKVYGHESLICTLFFVYGQDLPKRLPPFIMNVNLTDEIAENLNKSGRGFHLARASSQALPDERLLKNRTALNPYRLRKILKLTPKAKDILPPLKWIHEDRKLNPFQNADELEMFRERLFGCMLLEEIKKESPHKIHELMPADIYLNRQKWLNNELRIIESWNQVAGITESKELRKYAEKCQKQYDIVQEIIKPKVAPQRSSNVVTGTPFIKKAKKKKPNKIRRSQISPKLSMAEAALYCFYKGTVILKKNSSVIARKYGWKNPTSGQALYQQYLWYALKANRIGVEDTDKKNRNKITLLEKVVRLLGSQSEGSHRAIGELQTLRENIECQNDQ